MRLRAVVPVPPPPSIVNSPPTRIFPSGCTADGVDLAVRAGIEIHVERAISMQPADPVARRRAHSATTERREVADDQDLPIGLRAQRLDGIVGAGIEAGIDHPSERSRPIRLRVVVPVPPPSPVNSAAEHDPPVGLHDQRQ